MGKAAALVEGFVRKESPEASAEPAGETRGHVCGGSALLSA